MRPLQKFPFFILRREGVACLFLALTILAVYWQVGNHEFVNFDDKDYITENQHVQAGLTLKSIAWAFTSTHASNWHPITWLWYLGTLVPVIGLVQVGSQAMADRYTYIPLTGIFIIIAWGILDLIAGWRYKKEGLAAASAIILSILMVITWFQIRHWTNSITLFSHAINVTANNSVAHNNLGIAFGDQDNLSEAIKHYTEALRIKPDYAKAHNNLGNALADQGKLSAAIKHYKEALRINPDFTEVRGNLKKVLGFLKEIDEAIQSIQELLEVNPEDPRLHYDLGNLYYKKGEFDKTIFQYQKSLSIQPDNPSTYYNLACMYSMQNRLEKSLDFLKKAIEKGYENWEQIKTDGDLENIRGTSGYRELVKSQ